MEEQIDRPKSRMQAISCNAFCPYGRAVQHSCFFHSISWPLGDQIRYPYPKKGAGVTDFYLFRLPEVEIGPGKINGFSPASVKRYGKQANKPENDSESFRPTLTMIKFADRQHGEAADLKSVSQLYCFSVFAIHSLDQNQ